MKNLLIRGAAVAAASGIALAALATGPANADTFIPLPGGHVVQPLPGGGSIVISLTGEHAVLSPGMVALPTTRNAWVSGNVRAKINGPSSSNGSLKAGYVVGCQIAVGSTNIAISGSASGPNISYTVGSTPALSDIGAATGSAGSSAGLTLSAGTIGAEYLTFDKPTWPKPGDSFKPDVPSDQGWQSVTNGFSFTGDSGSLAYSDETIGVDGCAGYAQARFFTYVTGQTGNHEGTATLWGKPFTLG